MTNKNHYKKNIITLIAVVLLIANTGWWFWHTRLYYQHQKRITPIRKVLLSEIRHD